ncbi:L,D-transpeptidase family protein [Kitasatospora sp. RB6PN24]|uniref:L,D-transpeptidase family protein n=1 Tax=Kitasatospora humi TaxID=2893891 RepID=UPI001E542E9B|nr:L,D-transpeptidase family protein [Kitasatospora humi]MCC9311118.1 L,D-transpeptidase family protein [Kitasatospora humi]
MPAFRDRLAKPRASVARRAAAAALGAAAALSGLAAANGARAGAAPPGTVLASGYLVCADGLSGSAHEERAPGSCPAPAVANRAGPSGIDRRDGKPVLPAGPHVGSHTASPFPVPVAVGRATQVITVKASGTYAAVTLWARTAHSWHTITSTTAARIGSHGITDGATRIQGSDTTPTGTYTITEGFGVGANPGTKMPYHQVTAHDWWVQDPTSAYYNQMRTDTQGGFHLTETGDDGSEHLINHPIQYHNALVINFNTSPVVKGRGAGIFLHDLGPQAGPTSGCVAVPADFMTRVMRWINPADHPVIAIG